MFFSLYSVPLVFYVETSLYVLLLEIRVAQLIPLLINCWFIIQLYT